LSLKSREYLAIEKHPKVGVQLLGCSSNDIQGFSLSKKGLIKSQTVKIDLSNYFEKKYNFFFKKNLNLIRINFINH
ncbi:hypothetical protein, partial [Proteus columbae]|uniref:hypothetical protein n=1 Tax=Proteus columbae TaxID=1987580 RepID=UPI001E3A3603